MSELIEMPYGNGKALESEFIKKYEEVQNVFLLHHEVIRWR